MSRILSTADSVYSVWGAQILMPTLLGQITLVYEPWAIALQLLETPGQAIIETCPVQRQNHQPVECLASKSCRICCSWTPTKTKLVSCYTLSDLLTSYFISCHLELLYSLQIWQDDPPLSGARVATDLYCLLFAYDELILRRYDSIEMVLNLCQSVTFNLRPAWKTACSSSSSWTPDAVERLTMPLTCTPRVGGMMITLLAALSSRCW